MKTQYSQNKAVVIAAVVLIFLIFAVCIYFSKELSPGTIYYSPPNEAGLYSGVPGTVHMDLPAINANDTGVSAKLTVTVKKGTGKLLFGISNALSSPDTQQSARTAALYAANRENISLESIDISYDIRASASLVEGPSAGAAFTIATIAALTNKTVQNDVMITGAINHDGTIGPSGRIFEKAQAAKKEGARLFLVPVGSIADMEVNYTEQEFCHTWGGYEYCQPEFVSHRLNVSEEAGIPIVEVASVEEALPYFLVS